jgi:N-acetylneuraminic acid mutarotase
MRKYLILIILASTCALYAQDSWQQLDSVNGPSKGSCAAFVIQGEGFVVGGLDDFGFKRKMYSYDPFQNDWDDELSLGGLNGSGLDRASATSFSINNKGYVCLGQGQTNPYFKDLWEYNHETEAWTQKADFIGTARRQAIGFSVDDFGYVGTGQDAAGLCNDFYKFDPTTNTWSQLNDFPGTPRRQAVGFAMGGEGYVGTGDDGVLRKDFWMYQPTTDTWIQKADFPGTARAGATGWGVFPTGFIATGEDINFEYKKDVWEYNYFSNSWIQRADLPGSARKNAISFVIDGIAYLGTGFNGTFMDDFYSYTGIVGLKDEIIASIEAFPNPTTDRFIIKSKVPLRSDQLEIYSITGQNVSSSFNFVSTPEGGEINCTNAVTGNYIVRIHVDNQQILNCKLTKI